MSTAMSKQIRKPARRTRPQSEVIPSSGRTGEIRYVVNARTSTAAPTPVPAAGDDTLERKDEDRTLTPSGERVPRESRRGAY